MHRHSVFLAALLFVAGANAQTPAPQLSQEQAQQLMMKQMQMMATLFDYRRSRFGFDETVASLSSAIEKQGWQKGQVHDIKPDVTQAGANENKQMKIIMACPNDFNDKLAKASQGKLPPHPCRFTVFEGRDGKAYVVRMNSAQLGKGIKGEASKLMSEIGAEEEAILKHIVE